MTLAPFAHGPFLSRARWSSVTSRRHGTRAARQRCADGTEAWGVRSRTRPSLTLLLPISFLLSLAPSPGGVGPAPPSAPLASTLERQTHARVNKYRASEGLTALAWNDLIADLARQHSQDMARGATDLGHDGFEDRVAAIGQTLPWSDAAENVSQATGADAALKDWLNSRGHRSNIEGDFDLTGVGAATRKGAPYVTQIFIKCKYGICAAPGGSPSCCGRF